MKLETFPLAYEVFGRYSDPGLPKPLKSGMLLHNQNPYMISGTFLGEGVLEYLGRSESFSAKAWALRVKLTNL